MGVGWVGEGGHTLGTVSRAVEKKQRQEPTAKQLAHTGECHSEVNSISCVCVCVCVCVRKGVTLQAARE